MKNIGCSILLSGASALIVYFVGVSLLGVMATIDWSMVFPHIKDALFYFTYTIFSVLLYGFALAYVLLKFKLNKALVFIFAPTLLIWEAQMSLPFFQVSSIFTDLMQFCFFITTIFVIPLSTALLSAIIANYFKKSGTNNKVF